MLFTRRSRGQATPGPSRPLKSLWGPGGSKLELPREAPPGTSVLYGPWPSPPRQAPRPRGSACLCPESGGSDQAGFLLSLHPQLRQGHHTGRPLREAARASRGVPWPCAQEAAWALPALGPPGPSIRPSFHGAQQAATAGLCSSGQARARALSKPPGAPVLPASARWPPGAPAAPSLGWTQGAAAGTPPHPQGPEPTTPPRRNGPGIPFPTPILKSQ